MRNEPYDGATIIVPASTFLTFFQSKWIQLIGIESAAAMEQRMVPCYVKIINTRERERHVLLQPTIGLKMWRLLPILTIVTFSAAWHDYRHRRQPKFPFGMKNKSCEKIVPDFPYHSKRLQRRIYKAAASLSIFSIFPLPTTTTNNNSSNSNNNNNGSTSKLEGNPPGGAHGSRRQRQSRKLK